MSPMRETEDSAVVSSTDQERPQPRTRELDPGGIQCVELSYSPVP